MGTQHGMSRRHLLGGAASGAAAAVAIGSGGSALARATAPASIAPGFFRRAVGDVEVTALLDGTLGFTTDELQKMTIGSTPDAAAALSTRSRVPAAGISLPVAAFLIRSGDRLVLVDTGTSNAFQPELLGRLPAALRASGYAPEQVDTILLTHAHADHAGGLLDLSGGALYPNAEVVLTETEHKFWTDSANEARASDLQRPFFAMARAALKPYAARTRLIADGTEAASGITSVALPGHTPGHTGYRIASGREQLLIWGDALHVAAWQFDRPEWSLVFDIDPAAAAATRRRTLDMVATDGLLVAGMHLPFPGFAYVSGEGGAYRYLPAL